MGDGSNDKLSAIFQVVATFEEKWLKATQSYYQRNISNNSLAVKSDFLSM